MSNCYNGYMVNNNNTNLSHLAPFVGDIFAGVGGQLALLVPLAHLDR